MCRRRVVVTGIGVIAGNGRSREEFFENSMAGISGIRPCMLYPTEGLRTEKFGEVEGVLSLDGRPAGMADRMKALMECALSEMYANAGVDAVHMRNLGRRACLFLGSLLASTEHLRLFARSGEAGEPGGRLLAGALDYGPWLAKKSGVRGGLFVDSAACAAGTTAAGMAFDYVAEGLCDAAVVGGADALSQVTAWGFHALSALSADVCSPFDEERDGINIGEGAAFFLFETPEAARARGAHIYGEILGYGLNNDAYHITSPDPEGAGAVASMESALSRGGIAPEQVDYVNVHGTGTGANDAMECKAMGRIFGGRAVAANSTKALVGHCMGASGAIELAAVLLAIDRGGIAPMPRLVRPMEALGAVDMRRDARETAVDYVLSNSFAFAGNTASVLAGRYRDEE